MAGLDASAPVAIDELELADGPLVLVVGSEGQGLSRLVAERCDVLASIPIHRATESLNAGIAAGVALYEVSRRRAISGSGRPAAVRPARRRAGRTARSGSPPPGTAHKVNGWLRKGYVARL